MTHPTPVRGALFLLDGLPYELGATDQIPNEARTGFVAIREVTRPEATPEDAARHKANFHYKKSVTFLEAEMVHLDRETWQADLREQAETLARNRPQARVWCEEAVQVQEAQTTFTHTWALPGRHLLKPPVRYNPNPAPGTSAPIGYESFYPQDRKEAARLAAAILAHDPCPSIPLTVEG